MLHPFHFPLIPYMSLKVKSETETGKPGSEKQTINIKRVDQVEICLLEDDKADWL